MTGLCKTLFGLVARKVLILAVIQYLTDAHGHILLLLVWCLSLIFLTPNLSLVDAHAQKEPHQQSLEALLYHNSHLINKEVIEGTRKYTLQLQAFNYSAVFFLSAEQG